MGTLMELVGLVTINCIKTDCKAEIDFKAKPFFGGDYNTISAKVKRGKDTLYTISGKWDGKIDITNTKTKSTELLWDPKGAKRVPKITPSIDEQEDFESQKLWTYVTAAIKRKDQRDATNEKTKLEEGQRAGVKLRRENGEEWEPRLFRLDEDDNWIYKYIDTGEYNPKEGEQDESEGIIYSKGRGKEATLKRAAELFGEGYNNNLSTSPLTLPSSGSRSKNKSNGKGKYW